MPFDVSFVTLFDQPGNEVLLHICHPAERDPEGVSMQASATSPGVTDSYNADELGKLSHREVEVLSLIADKTSTQQIADTLSISIRTVRTHIQHAMQKLRVHKRKDAVRVAKDNALI